MVTIGHRYQQFLSSRSMSAGREIRKICDGRAFLQLSISAWYNILQAPVESSRVGVFSVRRSPRQHQLPRNRRRWVDDSDRATDLIIIIIIIIKRETRSQACWSVWRRQRNQLFISATLRSDSAVQCHLTAWLFLWRRKRSKVLSRLIFVLFCIA